MKLSIITINYNNVDGLRKTLASVAGQTYKDIEHIIVDGGSTDGSVDVIKEYAKSLASLHHSIIWVSEPDNGIYNAMNKGIEIALGRRIVNSFNRSELVEDKNKGIEIALGRRVVNADHTSSPNSLNAKRSTLNESLSDYIQILNSGDILAADNVTERMMSALDSLNAKRSTLNENGIPILYGNMVRKDFTTGKIQGKSGEVEYSFLQYYRATINHDCCYIRRDLFNMYGLYDESLKIVSDWKWFLQAIGLGNVKPKYVDIDVTHFDVNGISESNLELRNKERRHVLEEVLSPAVLADYDKHALDMEQIGRLRKHHLYWLVYFMERVLCKLEKMGFLKE